MARGLHYAGLTDAAWSADGKTLFVTSSDGYVSILSFANGELGEPIAVEQGDILKKEIDPPSNEISKDIQSENDTATPSVNILAPKKKKKVTLNLEANVTTEIENVLESNPIVVNTLVPKKKKKVVPVNVADVAASDSGKRLSDDISCNEAVNVLLPKKKAKVEEMGAADKVNVLVPKKKDDTEDAGSKEVVNILLPKKKTTAVIGSS